MTAATLSHHGVKGMKWGVRKSPQVSDKVLSRSLELKPNADGSIDIPRGLVIQRVANLGSGFMHKPGLELGQDYTYASFTKGDNLRYEARFGFNQSIFRDQASTVLKLKTKVPLKAPNPADTSKLYYDSLKDDPATLATVRKFTSGKADKGSKALEAALLDPKSKEAYLLFSSLHDGGNFIPKIKGANEGFYKKMQKSGYNMLLDPSDSTFLGLYDAPIVVLGGSKNLDIVGRDEVTKHSRKSAFAALKEYESINKGKMLMEQLGYD